MRDLKVWVRVGKLARFEPQNKQAAECDCCGKRRCSVKTACLASPNGDADGFAYCAECRNNTVHPLDSTFCATHY